jgi:uncharacterized iron-regulated membrane protein
MDDRTLRVILIAAFFGLMAAFREPIKRWLHKIGYRDWRDPDK